jgi:septum formation protein
VPPARRLVLASASPARLALLRGAGFEPEAVVSGVDEDSLRIESPGALVLALAEAKATVVAARPEVAGALVIGGDSVLDVDGAVHGKPSSVDEARTRLRILRGRSAILRTGHCVVDTAAGRQASDVASTEVFFGSFDDDELDSYLATGEALHVAGGLTLDGRSGPFVERIDGDHGNVIGLSLPLLRDLLRCLGLSVADLWT